MAKITFFSVLKNNVKCLACKQKDCQVRYYPERKKVSFYEGTRYVNKCEKDKIAYEKKLYKN